MSDTLRDEEINAVEEPELDLDSMLRDLHENFPDPDEASSSVADEVGGAEEEGGSPSSEDAGGGTSATPPPDVLPPGMVDFGGQILEQTEAQALLELNRQVKEDPEKARRVREAILGQQPVVDQRTSELPEWLDPDDSQAVFFFRQQQRMEAELGEIKAAELRRQQAFEVQSAEQRKQQVINSFRTALGAFHSAHPELEQDEVRAIVDVAANRGLLEAPEKLDPEGSLEGGMGQALDMAMWSVPEYREKVLHSDTVRTKAQQSQDRKHKSSALSSSTGSTPRNTTQEARPGNRQEMMQNALADFRSGLLD